MSLGSEVTIVPFFLFRRGVGLKDRVLSAFIRRALSRVSCIITGFPPTMESIARLGYAQKMRVWGFPEDVKGNIDRVDAELLKELNTIYCKYDRVFLWLSRLVYLDPNSEQDMSEFLSCSWEFCLSSSGSDRESP